MTDGRVRGDPSGAATVRKMETGREVDSYLEPPPLQSRMGHRGQSRSRAAVLVEDGRRMGRRRRDGKMKRGRQGNGEGW